MENLRQVLYNFHRCNNNSTQFNQEMEKTTNTTECQGENTFYENSNKKDSTKTCSNVTDRKEKRKHHHI